MDGTCDHLIAFRYEVGGQVARNGLRKTCRAEGRQQIDEAAQICRVFVGEYDVFRLRRLDRRHAAKAKERLA
ncbi:hypothetical protein C1X43_34215 [Pseudomonas sp. GW460-C3]|nr:hypothetical protein C1X43_34215 [Pseudomonas sp. GW460-C3]